MNGYRSSDRIIQQRLRNRAIEALETLSAGDEGVRAVGNGEYVEQFFDVIDDDVPWEWRHWSCFTPDELAALDRVQTLLRTACDATAGMDSDDEFIASGWPATIQPVARQAFDLMRLRGRFSEDVEEDEPSPPG